MNDVVGGLSLVVLWAPGTASALDGASISASRDVGATGVFSRRLGKRILTFERLAALWRDRETGSSWSLTGEAVSGPLKGQHLSPLTHANHFWFAWAAFRPATRIYR